MSDMFRDPFQELAKNEALGTELTEDEMASLTTDPWLWGSALGCVINDLNVQLSTTDPQDREDYREWRKAVLWIRRRLEARLGAVKQIQREQHHASEATAFYALRRAVMAHKAAVEAADLEPEPHDIVLWDAALFGHPDPRKFVAKEATS